MPNATFIWIAVLLGIKRVDMTSYYYYVYCFPSEIILSLYSIPHIFSFSGFKFKTFLLFIITQEEFDTYDQNVHLFLQLQFLRKRSKIIEIVAAKDIIFALAQSGLCAAFSRSKHLISSKFFIFFHSQQTRYFSFLC